MYYVNIILIFIYTIKIPKYCISVVKNEVFLNCNVCLIKLRNGFYHAYLSIFFRGFEILLFENLMFTHHNSKLFYCLIIKFLYHNIYNINHF
jgi:hypothetical protein